VLLTRSPLGTAWCCHQTDLARLACVRHAASVRPEPGSNSPSEIVELPRRARRGGHAGDFALVWNSVTSRPPRLTIPASKLRGMGDTRDRSQASLVLAHPYCPDVPKNRHRVEQSGHKTRSCPPHVDGVQSTGFSHTVEFSRSLVGTAPGDSPVVPDQVPPPERRSPYLGPSRFVNRATCRPRMSEGLPPYSLSVPHGPALQAPASTQATECTTVDRPSVFPRIPLSRYLLPPHLRHRGDGASWPQVARTVSLATPVFPLWGR
jgi:hypothetical protein